MPKIAVNLSHEQVEALSRLYPDLPIEDALLTIVNSVISSPPGKAPKPEDRSLKVIIDTINAYTGKIDEISRKLSHLIELLEDLAARVQGLEEEVKGLSRLAQQAQAAQAVQVPQEERREPRKSAIDILREQRVMFESDIAGKIRNRDAFFEKLRRSGALVIGLPKERVAVDPEFFSKFKEKVEGISSSSDEVLQRELDKVEVRLLKALANSGLAYFDGVKKRWVVDVDAQSP